MIDIEYEEVKRLFESGVGIAEIARRYGVSQNTIRARCETWEYDYGKKGWIQGNWENSPLEEYDLTEDGIRNLVTGIINNAVNEYRMKRSRREDVTPLVRFFRSPWFEMLMTAFETEVQGETIIRELEERINGKTK